MAKITSLNGAHPQAETFDPLLPVELVLPFPGHWGQIRAIYSVAAVLDLSERWTALISDIATQAAAADTAAQAAQTPDEQRAALSQQRAVRRALNLRIIGACVQAFTWPFKGPPPDPTDPAAFAAWPDPVLNWLSEGALQEVRKRVDDPLLWTASAAT
jgi:hypothetical protein